MNDRNVNLLMTIPGMGIYSSAAIMSEIDDISLFATKEKLAAYAGLVPRQDQSGNRDIKGHISKHGPSMLRFIMVNAAHIVVKYSDRMRRKYLSLKCFTHLWTKYEINYDPCCSLPYKWQQRGYTHLRRN